MKFNNDSYLQTEVKEIVVTKYKDIQIEKRNKRKRAVEDTNSIKILNPQQESLLNDKVKHLSRNKTSNTIKRSNSNSFANSQTF
ncbi:15620_t:CDS:2 [Funneliformis mosseae]|uniref:15620_t:CDS:1 n=1 Tax=Funneliformis mosseae TaxID=27381 RepID=A0A9N8WLM7_FUNMO|nr:15620_t:CDS:2 [Funneliformis mosseae]